MRNNQSRTGQNKPVPTSPAPVQSNLAYVTPTEFVELPSRGEFYHEHHPLHGQETVEIKFMTAKEEDILSSAALIKKGLAIDRLIKSIVVPEVSPDDLLVGDRNAIMIAARISSYGREYNAATSCPSCDVKIPHLFDLEESTLSEKCFDQDFLDGHEVRFSEEEKTFSVVLPISKVEVGIRMLTGQDEKDLVDISEDKTITSVLSAFVVSVAGETGSKEVKSFIENMPASDSKFLRDLFGDLSPGISLKQEFICEVCFFTQEMEVPLTADFFWPK